MTAPELILHIGRHKSGTSSLQHFLGAARDHLSGQGVLYPQAGCPNRIAHHAIAAQCHSGQSDGADLAAAVRRELEPHHARILLSSEAFQNLPDLTRLRDFADALDVGRIRVLCYLREHLDYAVSGYRQMIQNQPRFVPFRKFVRGLGDMAPFVARWRALGDLELCWYDRSRLKDGDIIADACTRLEIAPGEIPQGDMNPSIGGNLLVYKLAANKLGLPAPDYGALRDLAAAHAPFRSAFHIADEDAARLRAHSRYNASLVRLMGPLPGLKSWATCPELPQRDRLQADLARIGPDTPPRLAAAMTRAGPWLSLAPRIPGGAQQP